MEGEDGKEEDARYKRPGEKMQRRATITQGCLKTNLRSYENERC